MESKDVSKVDETLLDQVEADVYWCLTKLLDNIQVRRGEHPPVRGCHGGDADGDAAGATRYLEQEPCR